MISSNHTASNGVVHLIDGFLQYRYENIGERLENDPDMSTLQEGLTKVDLFDLITGRYYSKIMYVR